VFENYFRIRLKLLCAILLVYVVLVGSILYLIRLGQLYCFRLCSRLVCIFRSCTVCMFIFFSFGNFIWEVSNLS
jgi:hypothetical protein